MYIYMYICTRTHIHTYIYIYVYIIFCFWEAFGFKEEDPLFQIVSCGAPAYLFMFRRAQAAQ